MAHFESIFNQNSPIWLHFLKVVQDLQIENCINRLKVKHSFLWRFPRYARLEELEKLGNHLNLDDFSNQFSLSTSTPSQIRVEKELTNRMRSCNKEKLCFLKKKYLPIPCRKNALGLEKKWDMTYNANVSSYASFRIY